VRKAATIKLTHARAAGNGSTCRDLGQVLAHVHDADLEIGEGPMPSRENPPQYQARRRESADLAPAADATDLPIERDVVRMAFYAALIVRLGRRLVFRRHRVFRMMRGLPCEGRRGCHQAITIVIEASTRMELPHPQIVRGLPAAIVDDVERHLCAFDQAAVASLLDDLDMYEYVVAAIVGHDEAKTPFSVEKLHCSTRHGLSPSKIGLERRSASKKPPSGSGGFVELAAPALHCLPTISRNLAEMNC
jgi:hypothetical protein